MFGIIDSSGNIEIVSENRGRMIPSGFYIGYRGLKYAPSEGFKGKEMDMVAIVSFFGSGIVIALPAEKYGIIPV